MKILIGKMRMHDHVLIVWRIPPIALLLFLVTSPLFSQVEIMRDKKTQQAHVKVGFTQNRIGIVPPFSFRTIWYPLGCSA